MAPETKTVSHAAGINGGDVNDATITRASDTSESSAINGGQERGQWGRTIRVGHRGCYGRGGCFNLSIYTSSINNFKEEVSDFGVVLGTTYKQREAKDKHKKFSKNLKQNILR